MMACLSFSNGISYLDRKRLQLDIQQELTNRHVKARSWNARATLEIRPDKRVWSKAQTVFLRAMREIAGLGRQVFDIQWLTTGIRMSVNGSPRGLQHWPNQPRLPPGLIEWSTRTGSRFGRRTSMFNGSKRFWKTCDVEQRN